MRRLVIFVTIFLVIYQASSSPAEPEQHSNVKRSFFNGDLLEEDVQCPGGNCQALASCVGPNCVTDARRFLNRFFNKRITCSGGNCRFYAPTHCVGPNCVDDARRYFDNDVNGGCPGGNCLFGNTFGGCSGGDCRQKRSAEPWNFDRPCKDCPRSYDSACVGPNCLGDSRRFVYNNRYRCPGGDCRFSFPTPCVGPNCIEDGRRFMDINRRFLDINNGCPGGNCRMKRSADPQCSGGRCRRNFDMLLSGQQIPCIGPECGLSAPGYFPCIGPECGLSGPGTFPCIGPECGLSAPGYCVGPDCVGDSRRYLNRFRCPGGDCRFSYPAPCVGPNCIEDARRFMDFNVNRRFLDNSALCVGGNCIGERFDCAGGECLVKRSVGAQDDKDNLASLAVA